MRGSEVSLRSRVRRLLLATHDLREAEKMKGAAPTMLVATTLIGAANGLALGQAPTGVTVEPACAAAASSQRPLPLGRRAALFGAASTAMLPLAAFANTQPMLDKPTEKFEADEARRKVFLEKQKVFKKQWRKQLAELEFSSNDEEAMQAIDALIELIQKNGMEIPEGIRKQDMDQVYRTVQGKLQKPTRMEFKKLDAIVQQIVTVKSMGVDLDSPL